MKILCNGEPITLNEACSVFKLMVLRELSSKKDIAVAVNNVVVPKKDWEEHILQNDDNVLIITAVQGG